MAAHKYSKKHQRKYYLKNRESIKEKRRKRYWGRGKEERQRYYLKHRDERIRRCSEYNHKMRTLPEKIKEQFSKETIETINLRLANEFYPYWRFYDESDGSVIRRYLEFLWATNTDHSFK